jgi:hypothetical protein
MDTKLHFSNIEVKEALPARERFCRIQGEADPGTLGRANGKRGLWGIAL